MPLSPLASHSSKRLSTNALAAACHTSHVPGASLGFYSLVEATLG